MRQIADVNGYINRTQDYEPYGSVLSSSGSATSVYGFTGEQTDSYIKLVFLRARYYSPETARFLSKDVWQGDYTKPQSLNAWGYTEGNPVNRVDPTGRVSEEEKWYMRYLYYNYVQDAVSRLHDQALTNLSDGAFAAMILAKFLVEDATPYADSQPLGQDRTNRDILMGSVPGWVAILVQQKEGRDYSWGPSNIPMTLADRYLAWWEENYAKCSRFNSFETSYYDVRNETLFNMLNIFNYGRDPWPMFRPYEQVARELISDKGAVEGIALAILESSDRARKYWRSMGQPSHERSAELSAYTIALGVLNPYPGDEPIIYTLSRWESKGFAWNWVVEAVPWVAKFLDLKLDNFLMYTDEEKATLDQLPMTK